MKKFLEVKYVDESDFSGFLAVVLGEDETGYRKVLEVVTGSEIEISMHFHFAETGLTGALINGEVVYPDCLSVVETCFAALGR